MTVPYLIAYCFALTSQHLPLSGKALPMAQGCLSLDLYNVCGIVKPKLQQSPLLSQPGLLPWAAPSLPAALIQRCLNTEMVPLAHLAEDLPQASSSSIRIMS